MGERLIAVYGTTQAKLGWVEGVGFNIIIQIPVQQKMHQIKIIIPRQSEKPKKVYQFWITPSS